MRLWLRSLIRNLVLYLMSITICKITYLAFVTFTLTIVDFSIMRMSIIANRFWFVDINRTTWLCNNVVISLSRCSDCNQNRSYFERSKLKFECNFNTMELLRILWALVWVEGRVPTTISWCLRSPTRPAAAGSHRRRLTHTTAAGLRSASRLTGLPSTQFNKRNYTKTPT